MFREGRPITNPVVDGFKKCTCCEIHRGIEDFYFDTSVNKYRAECKECSRKKSKIRLSKNREQKRASDINRRYGLNMEEWKELVDSQNNLCAICGMTAMENSKDRNLHVDHNHETGQIRGMLCRRCNMGIGYFKENVENMQKAINYLNKYKL